MSSRSASVWNETFISLQTTTGVGKYLCGGSRRVVAPLTIAPSSLLGPELGVLFGAERFEAIKKALRQPCAIPRSELQGCLLEFFSAHMGSLSRSYRTLSAPLSVSDISRDITSASAANERELAKTGAKRQKTSNGCSNESCSHLARIANVCAGARKDLLPLRHP